MNCRPQQQFSLNRRASKKQIPLYKFLLLTLPVLATGVCAHAQFLPPSVLTLSETRAPNTPVGAVFDYFHPPILNNAGQVIFKSQLLFGSGGVDVSNDSGVWGGSLQGLFYVARELDQPPGVPVGARFGDFYNSAPVLNDRGEVAFGFTMQNDPFSIVTSANDTGVWFGPPGAMVLVAREGSPAAGLPGDVLYDTLNRAIVINNAGQLAFNGALRQGSGGVTSANDTAIWAGTTNSLVLVAREGDQVPGLPTGATFGLLYGTLLNDLGQVAFRADLNIGAGGVVSANNTLVMAGGFTNPLVVAREGWDALGGSSGVLFSAFSNEQLCGSNCVALIATLKTGSGGVVASNDMSLWICAPGETNLVAREGAAAAGGAGAVYSSFIGLAANTNGSVLFSGNMSPGGGGLWLAVSNGVSVVASANAPAANTPAGVSYGSFDTYALNNLNQAAFVSLLLGASVNNGNNLALFATDRTGQVRLVLREGDLLEIVPGDVRTVGTSYAAQPIAMYSDARTGRAINDRSQFAFSVIFTDNSKAILLADISGSPKLSIVADSSQAQLSWTTNFGTFNLQAAPQLPAVTWTNVGIASTVSNDLNQVLVPLAPGARFFRLATP